MNWLNLFGMQSQLFLLLIAQFYSVICGKKRVNGSEWSSYRCIGAPWYYHLLKPKMFRTNCRPSCIFQNVCYDPDIKALLFHRHPKDIQRPLLFDGQGTAHFDFPSTSFSFRGLRIKVVDYPNYPISKQGSKLTTILSASPGIWGSNFGHIMWSWLIPIYSLLNSFDVKPVDAVIAVTDNKTSVFDAYASYLTPNKLEYFGTKSCYTRLILADMTCENRKNMHGGVARSVLTN